MEIQQTPVLPQILQWLNGLTLPGIIVFAVTASRWYTKKEDEAKATIAQALASVETLRTNDLHHVQLSMDRLELGQNKAIEAMTEHKDAIVNATVASKDAIVQAILTLKS